jgi:hypothetical protein
MLVGYPLSLPSSAFFEITCLPLLLYPLFPGVPQWAMHSIRETCATTDVETSYELIKHVFADFPSLDKNLKVD